MKSPDPKEIEYCVQLLRRGRPIPDSLAHAEAAARSLIEPDQDEVAKLPPTPELEDIYEITYLGGTAAENRAKYPEVAAAADHVRTFFPNARVIALVRDRDPATSQ